MATQTTESGVAMVTLSIDGREVSVPKGTNLIEAARLLGISIPYLCYHHQLTAFGGCRLCLVEVEKVPKMLAACNTLAADGMVVRTSTDRVREQRAGTLEFILLNHPLDCPVCDKGGECELQDRVFEHSDALSRMTEPKVHVEDYDLGPLIVRNQDRCIICKRCIKVMEEVVGDPVLEFGQRGVTTEVYTFEHEAFPAGFSGNTIRVCPVGALMSKPFRFRARPWELIKTPGVCSLCSVGCNVRQDVRENRLLRVVGLENKQVNDGWLCDRGQFGYDYVNSSERLTAPLVRSASGALEETSWEEALGLVASKLREVRAAGGDAFAALGSERAANEDLFALQRFTREVMGSRHLDHRMGSTRSGYRALRPSPGAIEALGRADVALLVGTDLTAEAPVLDLVLKRGLLTRKMKLIVASPRATALDRFAHVTLRNAPGLEVALMNALAQAAIDEGLVPDTLREEQAAGLEAVIAGFGGRSLAELCALAGVTEEEVRTAARLFAGAKAGCAVFGQALADSQDGDDAVAALRNLAILSGQSGKEGHVLIEAVRECNTWGARDMGVLPDAGPGGAPVEPGASTEEILQAASSGRLQALYVMGSNPAVEYPVAGKATEALSRVPFLIVTEMFLTETALKAHVVLPVPSVAERNCTLTNVEGRVQRCIRAMEPRGASKPDWWILNALSEEIGHPLEYGSEAAVLRAIRSALAESPAGAAPGLQRAETPQPPAADAAHPFRLFTGSLMFDRGGLQRRSTVLPGLAPEPFAELNAADAARMGVADGSRVVVWTAQGELELSARVSRGVRAGTVFVPSGYDQAPAAWLLPEGARTAPCGVAPAGSRAGSPAGIAS